MPPRIDERILSAVSHAIAILPLGPLNIVITLVYWMLVRHVSPYVNHHGREALNFQITYNLALIVMVAVGFIATRFHGIVNVVSSVLFFAVLIAYGLFFLTLVVVAIATAFMGKSHRYPMTINFVK